MDHGIYGYVRPSASCLQAAASWQQRRHSFQARPEWITVTPGIDCAMATAVQAFTESGDKILINTPIYDPFFGVIEKNDRVTVDSPMVLTNGRYEFDWDRVLMQRSGTAGCGCLQSPDPAALLY